MSRALALGPLRLTTRRPAIVAAGGEAELDALIGAADADAVEVRADLFAAPRADSVSAALRRVRGAGKPVILTVRHEREGGRPLDETRRRDIYAACLPDADAIDFEIASTMRDDPIVQVAREHGTLVVLSAHALDAMPSRDVLLGLAERAHALGADVTKLAAHAGDGDDVRTMLDVTLTLRDRNVVTVGMGPAGTLSRLVLPAAGSLWTYGHVGAPTAPGQLTVAELAALVRRFYPG